MSIEIGELIKHCRCERGITQKELAGDYLSGRYISKIESDSTNITIDTLSFISEKLGVDLYSMYGRVNPYKSLTTFLECEKINQAIAKRDPQQIEKLYNTYKDRSEYSDGMEKMVLQYAKAIITADSHEYTEAIKATEEVIGNINLNENSHISNIEIALILSHAVNLCRINKVDDGTAELLALYKMAKNNYEAEVSESEDRKTFYVVAYIIHMFFPTLQFKMK